MSPALKTNHGTRRRSMVGCVSVTLLTNTIEGQLMPFELGKKKKIEASGGPMV